MELTNLFLSKYKDISSNLKKSTKSHIPACRDRSLTCSTSFPCPPSFLIVPTAGTFIFVAAFHIPTKPVLWVIQRRIKKAVYIRLPGFIANYFPMLTHSPHPAVSSPWIYCHYFSPRYLALPLSLSWLAVKCTWTFEQSWYDVKMRIIIANRWMPWQLCL